MMLFVLLLHVFLNFNKSFLPKCYFLYTLCVFKRNESNQELNSLSPNEDRTKSLQLFHKTPLQKSDYRFNEDTITNCASPLF